MTLYNMPLGFESFEELRSSNCYYVDKTGFITEVLSQKFKVNLITRPRRFGKTLALSTLSSFLDIRKQNAGIFAGLKVMEDRELCDHWMNQWPVLFVTLKEANKSEFHRSFDQLKASISDLCIEHQYLANSTALTEFDRELFRRLTFKEASEEETFNALYTLTRMMQMHYGKQVILLIDEYDVPLASASEYGYYDEMLDTLKGLLSKAFKSNPYLKFAVITGCLRIAKESIFTGTNNFVSSTISGDAFSGCFGFTETEVAQMLQYYNLNDCNAQMKVWYDGYRFGAEHVYCPWDVLNHVEALKRNPLAVPGNYWKNTSHNGIIRTFIGHPGFDVTEKFEKLLAGKTVKAHVIEDLTYDYMHSSEDNLWSILYLTGYLTRVSDEDSVQDFSMNTVTLGIPNEEIKTIFAETIFAWFQDKLQSMNRQELFDAWWNGDSGKVTELVTDLLFSTISYYDYREDYYHAFLAGIFTGAGYDVESNTEYGLGRPDIVVKDRKNRRALIIEVKHAKRFENFKMEASIALKQISDKQYDRGSLKGYKSILRYGAAFCEKECFIYKG